MRFTAKILVLLTFLCLQIQAQSSSNLDRIYQLIDKSVDGISLKLDNSKEYQIEFSLPSEYSILKNIVLNKFREKSKASFVENNSGRKLNYSIADAGIKYDKIFRKGFLGSYHVERNSFLEGSYSILHEGKVTIAEVFNYSETDTVKNSNLDELESRALPFTKSDRPAEPFLDSLLEPAVAIGTAAVTIFLFFSVRSK